MSPAEWIKATCSAGYGLTVNTGRTAKAYPFTISAGPDGFDESWERLSPVLRDIGVQQVADELNREGLS